MIELGGGSLRTKELTARIPGYSPRTVYRYANKLSELGAIERHEEPGVPSKVMHSLTEPRGQELHDLIKAYAESSFGHLPNGEIHSQEWRSLALLADFWESGMIDDLNQGPRSPTELARGGHDLSFHQVSRRASLFARGGFIAAPKNERRPRYELTEKARRAMALIAGIGRWRRRHVVEKGTSGLSAVEAAGLMGTVLPLASLPDHAGKSFELEILPVSRNGALPETVWAEIGGDGAVANSPAPSAEMHASAQGMVTAWVDSVLDGPRNGLRVKGDAALLEDCLRQVHAALWDRGQ
ncbi:MAG TPA: winged helix-turn-helix transcriptional regulator [Solirubrobacterales bacterium]